MNTLQLIVSVSIGLGLMSAVIIIADILTGNRQPMMVMNFVYPITALYAGVMALLVYYTIGKKHYTKTCITSMQL